MKCHRRKTKTIYRKIKAVDGNYITVAELKKAYNENEAGQVG